VFASFANAVDAAMVSVSATETAALNRPAAKIFLAGAGNVLVAGVELQMTFDTVAGDNDGMASLPGVQGLTAQTAGTFNIIVANIIATTGGTFTGAQVAIKKNGVLHYVHRDDSQDGSDVSMYLSGLIDAVPGDLFTFHAIKFGSAGGVANGNSLSARLTNRP
jgi:hypothetical protein